MKVVVLDEFPAWQIYLLAAVVLCGFLVALTLLTRSFFASSRSEPMSRMFARSGRQSGFFTIAGALALWFLGSSMYLRFHAMALGHDRVELFYFWPRPPEIIRVEDLIKVGFAAAHLTCGHVEITSVRGLHRSVNFHDCKTAQALDAELVVHLGRSLKTD